MRVCLMGEGGLDRQLTFQELCTKDNPDQQHCPSDMTSAQEHDGSIMSCGNLLCEFVSKTMYRSVQGYPKRSLTKYSFL